MKVRFFNSLIYILVIMLIIPGMTPGMASAINENLGDHGNSNRGNSTVDNGSSYIGDSGSNSDNGTSGSNSDNGTSGSNSDNGTSDSDSNKVDSGTTPDNGSSDSNSTSSDSDSNKVDTGTTPDNGSSDSNSTSSDSDSNKVDTGITPSNGSSDKSSGTVSSGSRDSGTQNSNNTSSDNENLDNESLDNESSNSFSNSSSSSSNYGMAPVSSEPASNIAVKELSTRSVMAGYPVRFDFVENSTCITYIGFDPKKTFRRTTTVVEELKNTSALVPTPPPGKIYKNVNIWVGEGAGLPTSIRNGLVGFKVEKSWIKEKNVSEALVTLQRYDKEWKSLSTEKVGEDDKYVYFEAETPGYSSFAITEYAGNGNGEEIQGADKIQETLKSLGSEAGIALNKGNSRIKNPMRAARILMAISLPLFMILAGYCVLKKKI